MSGARRLRWEISIANIFEFHQTMEYEHLIKSLTHRSERIVSARRAHPALEKCGIPTYLRSQNNARGWQFQTRGL
jgi:hypothetical protein